MKKVVIYGLTSLMTILPIYGDVSESLTEEIKRDIKKYTNEMPAIGMIMDKVEYDGVTLSNFRFQNGKKYIICSPNDSVTAHVEYEIDSDKLATFHLHHFIYGLDPSGPQGDLFKTLGFRDSTGDAEFTLKAPKEKGLYQVRFCHGEGVTYEKAKDAWLKKGNPPEKTIMGVVLVR